ncbi:MAG: hypothetical protein E7427_03660 [Ruminococcaceae bacterium]|nr:hypothetical protein [Oscillospiraceae bacterium]
MTGWIDFVNFATAFSGLVVSVLGLLVNAATTYSERWTRRFFTVFFSILTAYIIFDLLSQISFKLSGSQLWIASTLCLFFESLFSSMLMPMLTIYLLHCAGIRWQRNTAFYCSGVLWLIYFVLLVITQFTTAIYTITEENVYLRGPLYPLLLVPPVLLMLLNLLTLLKNRKALSRRQIQAFLVIFALPLVCMLIQMCVYGLLTIVIGTCAGALFLFFHILHDQFDRYIAQETELARQRASNRVLQMRPHFIYNTMMSIYYLIPQDAEKAQQVTLNFTNYLRNNFTALVREGTVPFAEELEHTRAYLAVEQVRFEGRLFVEFDTPCTLFRIPPLTLQPIVENAVKHGVSPDLAPLSLSVLTRETGAGAEIIVEDTGPGFAAADSDSPHIALANLRQRLDLMCHGTLKIEPRPAGGTKVTIIIPVRDAQQAPAPQFDGGK